MSDHCLVWARVKIRRDFQKRGNIIAEKRVVRLRKLEKQTCVKKYQKQLSVEWQKMKVNEPRGVAEEWVVFWEILCPQFMLLSPDFHFTFAIYKSYIILTFSLYHDMILFSFIVVSPL